MVLIPGNELGHEFYLPLAERLLERGFATRILTLPGFSGSEALERPGFDPLLSALHKELGRKSEPALLLIGHSLGGLLALLLAAKHPSQVEGLILLEPAIIPTRWLAKAAAKKYQRDVLETDRSVFKNWSGSFRRVHDLSRFPSWAIDHYLAVRSTADPELTLSLLRELPNQYPLPIDRISTPTLILRGAHSGLWPRLGLGHLARQFRSATSVTIACAAHWMANEQDEAIAEAIDRWVLAAIKTVDRRPSTAHGTPDRIA